MDIYDQALDGPQNWTGQRRSTCPARGESQSISNAKSCTTYSPAMGGGREGDVGEHPSSHTNLFIVAQSLGLLFGPAVQLIRGPNALDSLSRGETILTRGDVATSGRRVHHSVGQHKTIKTTINEHL